MKKTTSKNGNIFTTYTAKTPFAIRENGVAVYKVLVIWENSRIGRVIYDKYTVAA